MSTVLVLGARGFLGRRVVDGLRAVATNDVVESDVPARAREADRSGQSWLGLDLTGATTDEVADRLARVRPAVLVNCAGRTSGTPDELAVANVQTVARIVEAAESLSERPRLIHIGSAAEYGRQPEGVAVLEGAHPAPLAPYGATKLEGTRLISDAWTRGALDCLVLRVFNAVGPGMPAGSLVGAALTRLAGARSKGEKEIEMGPLGSMRDFVDVRDIAGAVAAAVTAPHFSRPIVNVGTGKAHSSRDLVEAIARRVGFSGRIAESAAGSERSGDVPWMVADVSAARFVLNWRAVHDLDDVADYVVRGTVL